VFFSTISKEETFHIGNIIDRQAENQRSKLVRTGIRVVQNIIFDPPAVTMTIRRLLLLTLLCVVLFAADAQLTVSHPVADMTLC
jgi:hypothetical protein